MRNLQSAIFLVSITLLLSLSTSVEAAESSKVFSPTKEAAMIAMTNRAAKNERDPFLSYLLLDRFEISDQSNNPVSWDATAWLGRDNHKLYFKSEGETTSGNTDSQNRLLYSHPVAPFWDVQLGLDYDQTDEYKNQTWATVGLQGLAPYFFETDIYLLANNDNVGIRFDGDIDFLLTQRLILTPRMGFEAYTQNQSRYGLGSGLSSTDIGVRLRYEFSRNFAPYLGIKWQNTYGSTEDFVKQNGGKSSDTSLVAGLRVWF